MPKRTSIRPLLTALLLLVAQPIAAQSDTLQPAAPPATADEALGEAAPDGSAEPLAAPALATPSLRLLPRLTPGARWLRKLTYSLTTDAAVVRGEMENATRWTDSFEVEVEITLLSGSRRGVRRYDLLFRTVEQPGATPRTRLPALPAEGDHWRCEGDETWSCTGIKGAIAPPFWLLPEWSAWWFEGRLGDDGAYTRVRGVARQLGLPAESRARLLVRTAGSDAAGLTELDLLPSGSVSVPVGDETASAALTGSGHLSVNLDAGLIPQLTLQWRASAEGRLPAGHGLFRRNEIHDLAWTETPLPAAPPSP
jgi:hypothetical protein